MNPDGSAFVERVIYRSSHPWCSDKFRKFSRKLLIPESLFKLSSRKLVNNFTEIRLQRRCYPVYIAKFVRKTFLDNSCK